MAILAGANFFVRLDYSEKTTPAAVKGDPDVVTSEITLRVNGNGTIEGENILFGIEKRIPYDGAMTLGNLVVAAQAAINGKAADTAVAVAAAPIVKIREIILENLSEELPVMPEL